MKTFELLACAGGWLYLGNRVVTHLPNAYPIAMIMSLLALCCVVGATVNAFNGR